MSQISAQTVMKLREMTGVSMSKCKEALEACHGDIEKAVDHLRKQGVASAVKKEGRDTKEGKISSAENGEAFSLVLVACETDFVVNNADFQQFTKELAQDALKKEGVTLEQFASEKTVRDPALTVDQARALLVQKIGENIQIKRVLSKKKDKNSSWGIYSHLGGKIVSCVEIAGSTGEETLAKDIGMHAAAAHPEYLTASEIPLDVIEREKEVARGQVKGKPDNIIEKIVDGKLGAFYAQVCLDKQKFIKDESVSIEELVQKRAKEIGKPLVLKSFIRWTIA